VAVYHTVEQGEHLSAIAARYGFFDYRTIWDDPHNAALVKKRKDPDVLFPGDQVYIPDKLAKEEMRATGAVHVFVVQRPALTLRLVIVDTYERPVPDAQCELTIDGVVETVTTSAEGRIEQKIPIDAKEGVIVVKDPRSRINELPVHFRIGHLDPVEEMAGQQARLNNLGYFAGPLESNSDEENQGLFASAVEEFQCEHGLTVDGKCGPKTQAKLREAHGA